MPASRARRLARRLTQRAPLVSVVVPFFNVEAYLAECLDSLLAQTLEDVEVLLVDDGSPDGSRAIAEEYAARDDRFRVVTRPNGGLGAARNTGVREAQGRYLTFVDSDDLLPADALAVLVASAEQTGSDLVCGAVERFDSRRTWSPKWVPEVHRRRRLGITLDDHVVLVRNLYTWDKLFRRDFFETQGLWFREGVSYEDQPIITQLFARAGSIDVLPDVVYRYRLRDDRSSLSQQTATLADLRDRVRAWELSREALVPELSQHAWEAWLQTLFEAHFRWYLASPGTADDTYWRTLQAAVVDLSAGAPAWVWDATPPAQRILVRLAQLDRRDDVRAFVEADGLRLDPWRAEVRPDGIRLALPYAEDPDVPDELALLRPEQVTLAQQVEHVRRLPGGRLWVDGWAYLRKVDLSTHDARVTVQLRHAGTGEVRSVPAGAAGPPVLDPPTDDPWCDHRPGRFAVELDLPDDHAWELWLKVEAAGLAAEEPLAVDPAQGEAEPQGTVATEVSVSPDGVLTVRGRVADVSTTEVQLSTRDQRVRVDGPPVRVEDGRFTARLPLARDRYGYGSRPFATGRHDLTVVVDGADEPLRAAEELRQLLPLPACTDLLEGRIECGPDAAVRLVLVPPLGDDRGSYAQRVLATKDWGPTRPAVLLDTADGGALLAELRRRGVDLPVHWVVTDHAVPVPDGVTPVVRGSAAHHELVATASHRVLEDRPAGGAGAPRLDVFRAGPDELDRERRRARRALGLRDEEFAVLHDPEGGGRLQARQVIRELGERYVVLVRGKVGAAARVRDVSDHPRPVDLLLAADVVVGGASQLVLDAVEAGLPVLLLDPDQAGLPGPVLNGTDQVVAALRDLDPARERRPALGEGRAAARVVDALLNAAESP